MTVEEYVPYPEEMCHGDYPKLPDIGADSRDNHYPYDNPELKRNFNEPVCCIMTHGLTIAVIVLLIASRGTSLPPHHITGFLYQIQTRSRI